MKRNQVFTSLVLSMFLAQPALCAETLDKQSLLSSKVYVPSLGSEEGTFEQLKDGGYKRDGVEGSFDKGLMSFGTANGHPIGVAFFTWNTGGTGWWEILALYTVHEGKPRCVGYADLEDRAKVNKVSIKNGVVLLDWLHHAPNDSAIGPSLHSIKRIKMSEFESTDKASEPILKGLVSGQSR